MQNIENLFFSKANLSWQVVGSLLGVLPVCCVAVEWQQSADPTAAHPTACSLLSAQCPTGKPTQGSNVGAAFFLLFGLNLDIQNHLCLNRSTACTISLLISSLEVVQGQRGGSQGLRHNCTTTTKGGMVLQGHSCKIGNASFLRWKF